MIKKILFLFFTILLLVASVSAYNLSIEVQLYNTTSNNIITGTHTIGLNLSNSSGNTLHYSQSSVTTDSQGRFHKYINVTYDFKDDTYLSWKLDTGIWSSKTLIGYVTNAIHAEYLNGKNWTDVQTEILNANTSLKNYLDTSFYNISTSDARLENGTIIRTNNRSWVNDTVNEETIVRSNWANVTYDAELNNGTIIRNNNQTWVANAIGNATIIRNGTDVNFITALFTNIGSVASKVAKGWFSWLHADEINATHMNTTDLIASGNVGIGTSNPGYTLDVTGSGVIIQNSTDSGDIPLILRNTDTIGTSETVSLIAQHTNSPRAGGKIVFGRIGDYSTGFNANSFLDFYTSNTDLDTLAMRIDENQNIGIGTSNPQSQLEIYKSGADTGIIINTTSNKDSWIQFLDDGRHTDWKIENEDLGLVFYSSEDDGATWTQAGSWAYAQRGLVIGSDPIYYSDANRPLWIGDSTPTIRLESYRASGGASFNLMEIAMTDTDGPTTSEVGKVGVYGSFGTAVPTLDYLFFCATENCNYNTNATLKVDNTGKVGIGIAGTDKPSYTLDVNGTTNIRGDIISSGNLNMTQHNITNVHIIKNNNASIELYTNGTIIFRG